MNDSGIAVDTLNDVDETRNFKRKRGVKDDDSPTSSDSNIDKISDDSKDKSSETPSDETLPPYSSLQMSPDASDVGLLKSREKEKPKRGCQILYFITRARKVFIDFLGSHCQFLKKAALILFIFFILGWLIVAMLKDWQRAMPLLGLCLLVLVFNLYSFLRKRFGRNMIKCCSPLTDLCQSYSKYLKIFTAMLLLSLLIVWIALDTYKRPQQLKSLGGYFGLLFILFMCSKSPEEVKWRPIIWGCLIQICLGFFTLRTSIGFLMFNKIGNFAQTFLGYVDTGAEFVFGVDFREHYFAFAVLPIIIYFSAVISILYHLGAMQWLIMKIAWLMQLSLGTSATESMVAAGNIFVGQTESPLLIRPYIKDLTTSELHAVMTAGFGTVAGSVLGAYLGFGVKAVYVITACVMAAPCALAVSKLIYPETKISKFASDEGLVLESSGHRNIIEAAFVGASQAIPLVLNIGANLIAFLALLAALNGFLHWFGNLVDIENLSFGYICAYVFTPFVYLLGVERADCYKCAELIGMKVFLNEFIAYDKLSDLMDNKKIVNMSRFDENGDSLWISDRSEAIVTYALCGFANIGSLGIQLGGLGGMCPERQSEMAKIVIRALFGGVFVSFLNACIAGFLYEPNVLDCEKLFGNWSTANTYELHQCCAELNSEFSTASSFNSLTISNSSLTQCCEYAWPRGYEGFAACT